MINPAVKNYLPQILEILKSNHLRKAYLFGSILTDKFREDSDIDIIRANL